MLVISSTFQKQKPKFAQESNAEVIVNEVIMQMSSLGGGPFWAPTVRLRAHSRILSQNAMKIMASSGPAFISFSPTLHERGVDKFIYTFLFLSQHQASETD